VHLETLDRAAFTVVDHLALEPMSRFEFVHTSSGSR